jgi:YggT family protein
MGPLSEALALIVRSLFGIIAGIFLIRLLMQGLRVDFRNPICQATYRFTNVVLQPLGKILPTLRSWNVAAFVVAFAILLIGEWLALFIEGLAMGPLPILLWTLGALVGAVVWMLFGMILIRVIGGYLSADPSNPVMGLLKALTVPLLRPFQRVIPPLAGFDLSPVFACLLLQVCWILLAKPLMHYALMMEAARPGLGV